MIVIRPHVVTDSTLDSSNVAETDHSAWNSGTTYNANDYVIVTTPNVHTIYKSVQGSNLNHDPATDDGTWWTAQGATNRWKMFDQYVSSQTSNSTSIVVDITPAELFNALALFNVSADTVQVVVDDPMAGEVYNQTLTMIEPPPVSGWYSWFFDDITQKSTAVFLDLPAYKAATVTVTISAATAKCGALVLGKQFQIGSTEWGAGSGIIDYSVKSTDEFGNFTITPRAYSDRVEFNCVVSTSQVSAVKSMLTAYRSTPLVWVGSERYEALIAYGFMKDFDINFSNLIISDVSIIVEGLT